MNSGLPMQFLPRKVANLNSSPPLALHYHSGTQAATPIILAYQFPGTSQRWNFGSIPRKMKLMAVLNMKLHIVS